MANIKQRLEKLESKKDVVNGDNNLILIMINSDETEDEAIVRYGYNLSENRSKFMCISFV